MVREGNEKEVNGWYYALAMFMCLDMLSTLLGIYMFGLVEKNPFMAQYWHGGQFLVIFVMFFMGFCTIYVLNEFGNRHAFKNVVVIAMNIFWLIIVTGNVLVIFGITA